MSKIREQEILIAQAAELRAAGQNDQAAALERQAAELQPHVDEQRAAIRAVYGGPLAMLGHAATEAAKQPPTPAWTGIPSRQEQTRRAHEALSGVRHTAEDQRRHAEAEERERERLRKGYP